MIEGVIFDHDGTLIDTEIMHFECWRSILLEHGIDFTFDEYIREHNGVPTSQNAQVLVTTYGINVAPSELVTKKTRMSRQRFAAKPSPLMPNAMETLARCHADGYTLGLATGAGHAEINQTMAAYDLRHFFDAIVTRDDVTQNKPAPDVYLRALELLEISANKCIAVEDTRAGISAAKGAGLRCIAVLNDYSSSQDLSSADYQCENLAAAFDTIKAL